VFNDMGPTGRSLLLTSLSVFQCPSDPGNHVNENRPFEQGVTIGKSNYPGNGGNDDGTGFFANNSSVRMRDVTDGTSNTIMVGERAGTPNVVPSFAALWPGVGGANDTPPARADADANLDGGGAVWGFTLYRMGDGESLTSDPFPQHCFNSAHAGGAQFLLGDGAVRFISENIDWTNETDENNNRILRTYNRLGARADGLPVGEF
jgi:hypothetical protein